MNILALFKRKKLSVSLELDYCKLSNQVIKDMEDVSKFEERESDFTDKLKSFAGCKADSDAICLFYCNVNPSMWLKYRCPYYLIRVDYSWNSESSDFGYYIAPASQTTACTEFTRLRFENEDHHKAFVTAFDNVYLALSSKHNSAKYRDIAECFPDVVHKSYEH
jgi:hypothetical protein